MWTVARSRTLILGGALAVFLVTGVLPLVYMIATSVQDVPVAVLLLDERQRTLVYNSGLLAGATAALATLIGVPLGFGLARMPMPRRTLLRIALATPVLLPPYVVALAWTYVGGSAGFGAALTGRDIFSGFTYSLPAASFVLALVYYPLVMLATEAALRQMDAHVEEAGIIAVPVGRVLARITLPLVAPAIGGAALIVFVLAISEFGVPALLRVRVYTTEVFTAFAALFDFARATALTLPLLLLAAMGSGIAAALIGERVVAGPRRQGAIDVLGLARWRTPVLALTVATVAAALVAPIVVLLRTAGGTSIISAASAAWPSIQNSVTLAAVGATLVVLIGAALGYARARASSRIGRAADVAWVVLFAGPSTITGVALIGLWNRPGVPGLLYGTLGMLVLVYLARFVPVAALIVAAGVRQIPVSHEDAAAVAGAGWLRMMRGVLLPQISRALAAAWVVAFVFAFGELGASILVSPPGESTLPIRIYTLIANTNPSVVAALALLQLAVIFVPLTLGAVYVMRRSDA
jgi:iron(III) transport system permease protein